MGGVELLPFYNNGGETPPASNWSTYGFGTPAFKDIFQAALEAHRDSGMIMDFALGPKAGNGVPAEVTDDGLQWDLYPAYTTVPANGSYSGQIPGWGTGELIALVSGLVTSETLLVPPYKYFGTIANYTQLIVKDGTLTDHTAAVSPTSGTVDLSFPATENTNTTYWVFAFWQYRTLYKNLEFSSNRSETIFDNGSYVVDHFSANGAQTVTKFWEDYILDENMIELLGEAGGYTWEDSVEIQSNISWTPGLPARFQEKFGYDIRPYLPLIMYNQSSGIQGEVPVNVLLDTTDGGATYVNDFRTAVQDGYNEYVEALNEWSRSYLNLGYSCQPSYNLRLDMAASVGVPDLPETESLTFDNNIDAYLEFSGPVHLVGKSVISMELAAVQLRAFSLFITDLIWLVNRAIVGGVNQFIIHGQSYSGNYAETTWPGYTAFWTFSDSNQNKNPAWNHGWSDAMDYLARAMYFQQQGSPRTDVAIFNKESATDLIGNLNVYTDTDLTSAGWTYSYISPDNFDLPQAYVKGNVLAPKMPAWKAMVILASQKVSMEALGKLQSYADAGLPVILSGGSPGYYPSNNADSPSAAFKQALAKFVASPNVYTVARGQVASKLADLGIKPRAAPISSGSPWYTTYREDSTSDSAFLFIFNNGNASTGELVVQTNKTPYLFDPWTGEQSTLLNYQKSDSTVTIPARLAANQTLFIGFSNNGFDGEIKAGNCHTSSFPLNVIGHESPAQNSVVLHVAASSASDPVLLSSGKTVVVDGTKVPSAIPLADWTLVAEHWEAPANLSDADVVAVKHNSTITLSAPLNSWDNIPELANVSGVGYYTSSFTWPPSSGAESSCSSLGAYLTLDPILHIARVWINGRRVPSLNTQDPLADISKFVTRGENSVLIIVPTTMWNYLRTILSEVEDAGSAPSLPGSAVGRFPVGLVGTPKVVPVV
ncbi:hypothetical protein BX600DRAFT_405689, partial [Xylariales sp. PMI_506]